MKLYYLEKENQTENFVKNFVKDKYTCNYVYMSTQREGSARFVCSFIHCLINLY